MKVEHRDEVSEMIGEALVLLHAADFGVLYRFRHPHPFANVHPPSALHDFFSRPEQ